MEEKKELEEHKDTGDNKKPSHSCSYRALGMIPSGQEYADRKGVIAGIFCKYCGKMNVEIL